MGQITKAWGARFPRERAPSSPPRGQQNTQPAEQAPEDAREEGEIYEHGVCLIWSGQEVLVVADSIQVGALRQLPDDWENIDWRLSLRLDANAPGEVSLRHLLFFKPVEK